jgi:cullin 1
LTADCPDFKSKKIRVNLNMPARTEQKVESTEVLQAVEEDRKFVYQATIVRLMKGRKVSLCAAESQIKLTFQTLKHQALIQEVTAQISVSWLPLVAYGRS